MNGRAICCVSFYILNVIVSVQASAQSSPDFNQGQPYSNDIPASFTSQSVVNTKPITQQQTVAREAKETNSIPVMNSTSPLSKNIKSLSIGPWLVSGYNSVS